jgi:hypothetical protein
MSSLTALEKRTFERLFNMGSGYVLGFSNRTMEDFFLDTVGIEIYDEKYNIASGSKANRLRAFWTKEPDHLVARLLSAMIELCETEYNPDSDLVNRAKTIVERLKGSPLVEDLDALTPNLPERDFELLARSVHDSIHNGKPQVGLDHLHTFVTRYIRALAEQEGVVYSDKNPLHSTFGEVIKCLRSRGAIETEMAERILKSSISTLESFSKVRNDRSLAHPNPLLSFDEALLIFRHVASSIRFLRTITELKEPPIRDLDDDDLPF